MGIKNVRAIVAGTGFHGRAERIRAYCRDGAPIALKREPQNPHDPDAIAVLMRCNLFFGLWKPWAPIGYIKASRADKLATRMDRGELVLQRAYVVSFDAHPSMQHPRVSIELIFEEHTQ